MLYIGGDISINHGSIVSCEWNTIDGTHILNHIHGVYNYKKGKQHPLGTKFNGMNSEFPEEIKAFADILSLQIEVMEFSATEEGNLIEIGLEWHNNIANYRGSRKKASVVMGELMAFMYAELTWAKFYRPSLTKVVLPMDKLTTIEQVQATKFPFEMSVATWQTLHHPDNDVLDKEGDGFDAIAMSFIRYLDKIGELDEVVEKWKPIRKEEKKIWKLANPSKVKTYKRKRRKKKK